MWLYVWSTNREFDFKDTRASVCKIRTQKKQICKFNNTVRYESVAGKVKQEDLVDKTMLLSSPPNKRPLVNFFIVSISSG